MLVYYGNIQCISARELIDGGYITESCYRNWVNRGRIKVVRRGGGAAGNCALVALNSLPTECLERVKEDNPGGTEQALRHWILSNYVLDQAAVAYFLDWASHSSSNRATDELARKYAVNASVLNTCIKLYNRNNDYRKLMVKCFKQAATRYIPIRLGSSPCKPRTEAAANRELTQTSSP